MSTTALWVIVVAVWVIGAVAVAIVDGYVDGIFAQPDPTLAVLWPVVLAIVVVAAAVLLPFVAAGAGLERLNKLGTALAAKNAARRSRKKADG